MLARRLPKLCAAPSRISAWPTVFIVAFIAIVGLLSQQQCDVAVRAAPTLDTTYFFDSNSSVAASPSLVIAHKVLVVNGSRIVIPISYDESIENQQQANANSNASLSPHSSSPGDTVVRNLELRNAELDIITANSSQDVFVYTQQASLRSVKAHVLETFNTFFNKPRSHDDQQHKETVRNGVIYRLQDLGFKTSFLQKSRFEFRKFPAFSYNMISILPGKHRYTKDEKIVLIGAHWDSATKAPGVDDNGSGSTCLVEIARIIASNRCNFNHTIMLVWFDYEEQGKLGSEFFVNDYLFPLELEKYGSKFIGAYILDMILVRDKENYTQNIPSHLGQRLPEFLADMERDKFRGDFLATWARKTWDEQLESTFRSSWIDLGFESRTFKAMRPILPRHRLPSANEKVNWNDFFRSDHASFWYPALTTKAVNRAPNRTSTAGHTSLNAILLTDLGPWRKSYSQCYHGLCDDTHFLTDNNLAFMQQVVDTLVLTLMRVAQGECQGERVPSSVDLALVPTTLPSPLPDSQTSAANSTDAVTSATSSPLSSPSPSSISTASTTSVAPLSALSSSTTATATTPATATTTKNTTVITTTTTTTSPSATPTRE